MTSTTVPTSTELIAAFPDIPTPHEGPPNYLSLKSLRDSLKANAASVETTLGGGAHGHLGAILPFTVYDTIQPPPAGQPHSWIDPPFPGATPTIPINATAHVASSRRDSFAAKTKTWKLNKNMNDALCKLILDSVGEIYLRALRQAHVGYSNIKARDMLQFLFTQYGIITPHDLQENNSKFYNAWDPTTPFETLIAQIEDAVEFAEDGKQPYTSQQILNNAYNLVYRSGLYFDDCKDWNAKPEADKTWANFKSHFLQAQRQQRLQQTATQQGFYGHLLNDHCTVIKDCLDEHTASQHTALSTLTSEHQQLNTVTNDLVKSLATLTQQMTELKSMVLNNTRANQPNNNNNRNNNNNNNNNRPRIENQNYCWTHGYRVGKNHTSATCQNPAPGHQKDATRDNIMGGSTRGKP